MLEAFSGLISFKSAELIDDFELMFVDATVHKPIGGINVGLYATVSFNFNKGVVEACSFDGSLIGSGKFHVAPVT